MGRKKNTIPTLDKGPIIQSYPTGEGPLVNMDASIIPRRSFEHRRGGECLSTQADKGGLVDILNKKCVKRKSSPLNLDLGEK